MGDTMARSDIAIESTIMAIREVLMEYFKGTCVQRMTDSQVFLAVPSTYAEYQYQRIELQNKQPRNLMLSGFSLLEVSKLPDTVTLNVKVFDRSPQLREVYAGVKEFLDKYLVGVEVVFNERGVIYAT
jgi:hypothetical protein